MNIKEFITSRIDDSVKNGVIHLKKEFEEKYSDYEEVTVDSLQSWLYDVDRKMQEANSFSMDHMYYWSLKTHLTDIVEHAKLLQEYA